MDMYDQGVVGWSSLHIEDSSNGIGIKGRGTEPVDGFCWKGDEVPGAKKRCGFGNRCGTCRKCERVE